jgi:hypothetical protein
MAFVTPTKLLGGEVFEKLTAARILKDIPLAAHRIFTYT